jgi:hypothetical protein
MLEKGKWTTTTAGQEGRDLMTEFGGLHDLTYLRLL